MTTTLQILSKTPTSISLRGTKNKTNSMAIAVGPGNNYEAIWANAAASQLVGSDQTGSFDVTFSSGLTSNTQYGAVAFLFGGGTGEVSSVLDGTLPSPALSSVSVNKLASDYVEMNFSMVADGGYYSRNVQYSLDNGSTWTTGYTASGGSAVSGQFITPLNLVANTAYTMQTRVSTTAGNTTSPSVSFTTLSAEPTITQEAATDTSVTIGYSFAADGGAYDKTIAYTVDGGAHWTQGVTVTGGGAATGNFTISNLQPNTSYNLIVRVTTGAGTITLDDMTITTGADHHLMYGPLEGEMFSGVTGVVKPGGIGNITAFDGATFTAKWIERGRTLAELEQHNGVPSSEIHVLKNINSENFSVRVKYGSVYESSTVSPANLPSWGFTYVSTNTGTDIIALTHQYSPSGTYTATKITNFYGPVNGETKMANKIYGLGPVEEKNLGTWQGNETTSFTAYLNFNIYIARTIRTNDSFRVIGKVGITYPNQASTSYAEIYNDLNAEINGSDFHIYTARTKVYGDGGDGTTSALTTDFDVTIPLASGTSTYAFDVVIKDTSHRKTLSCTLDSSGAGTKLIHQGFGHFPYYGQIVYYTDAGHTNTGIILLKNQSQINQLHGSWQGWETEIEGVQLNSADIKEVYIGKQAESIPQAFLIACSSIDTVDLSESEITSIPTNFLSHCSNFNGTLKLPPTTQTIGSLFLYEAKHFNQPLTIPTGVTSINYNFLYNASDFNQPITLPPSLVSLGYQFLYGCNKMTSTVNVGSLSADIATYNDRTLATNSSSAAMYRTGVTIAGANRAAWLAKFPNNNSVPFRKLVDAGY